MFYIVNNGGCLILRCAAAVYCVLDGVEGGEQRLVAICNGQINTKSTEFESYKIPLDT